MTLIELTKLTDVSPSHNGRIESGGRFPSVHVLRKLAVTLRFEEAHLAKMTDYMAYDDPGNPVGESLKQLDPYVAKVLSQEPVEVQRMVISALVQLKNIAEDLNHVLRPN